MKPSGRICVGLFFLIKIMEHHQTYCLTNVEALWQDFLLDSLNIIIEQHQASWCFLMFEALGQGIYSIFMIVIIKIIFSNVQAPWWETFVSFLDDINSSKCVLFYLFAPWLETFADAGDGDGGGRIGTNTCSIYHPI